MLFLFSFLLCRLRTKSMLLCCATSGYDFDPNANLLIGYALFICFFSWSSLPFEKLHRIIPGRTDWLRNLFSLRVFSATRQRAQSARIHTRVRLAREVKPIVKTQRVNESGGQSALSVPSLVWSGANFDVNELLGGSAQIWPARNRQPSGVKGESQREMEDAAAAARREQHRY